MFVLSIATARFSEAIIDFLADEKRASSKGIRIEDFEGEAYSIYELFSTVWLQSKEAKVCMQPPLILVLSNSLC